MRQQGYIPRQPNSYKQHIQQPEQPAPQAMHSTAQSYGHPQRQYQQPPYAQQPARAFDQRQVMKRDLPTLISGILGIIYLIVLAVYFISQRGSMTQEIGALGDLAYTIAIRLIAPHLVFVGLGVAANGFAWFLNNTWIALAGPVLYIVAILSFATYWLFVIPLLLFSCLGLYRIMRA